MGGGMVILRAENFNAIHQTTLGKPIMQGQKALIIPAALRMNGLKVREKGEHGHVFLGQGSDGKVCAVAGIGPSLKRNIPENLTIRMGLTYGVELGRSQGSAPEIQFLQMWEFDERLRMLQRLSEKVKLRGGQVVVSTVHHHITGAVPVDCGQGKEGYKQQNGHRQSERPTVIHAEYLLTV
jgi:hypothetical protein